MSVTQNIYNCHYIWMDKWYKYFKISTSLMYALLNGTHQNHFVILFFLIQFPFIITWSYHLKINQFINKSHGKPKHKIYLFFFLFFFLIRLVHTDKNMNKYTGTRHMQSQLSIDSFSLLTKLPWLLGKYDGILFYCFLHGFESRFILLLGRLPL